MNDGNVFHLLEDIAGFALAREAAESRTAGAERPGRNGHFKRLHGRDDLFGILSHSIQTLVRVREVPLEMLLTGMILGFDVGLVEGISAYVEY
jgi:hypothetical protein